MATYNAMLEAQNTIERRLGAIRTHVPCPGISVAVSYAGDRIIAASGLSDIQRKWELTREAGFGIGCVTKLLTALVFLKLSQTRLIELSTPIEDILPELRPSTESGSPLRVRHLLSHTGGYQGPLMIGVNPGQFSWNRFSEHFTSCAWIFRPGTVFNYENTGHAILGEVLRRLTGKGVHHWIREFIFDPLEILPGSPTNDYRLQSRYVSPHRLNAEGLPASLIAAPFGPFWESSLADCTLTLQDILSIGESLVDGNNKLEIDNLETYLGTREVSVPQTVSGRKREHSPHYFNSICAEYADNWYGYAGSASGQTMGFRFDLKSRIVCAVGMNTWLPIARDMILDEICGTKTHASAGEPGGNPGFDLEELIGEYKGGGNIFRSVTISSCSPRSLRCELGQDGLQGPDLLLDLDDEGQLVPLPDALMPGIGFFRERDSGHPCLMLGIAALKKTS